MFINDVAYQYMYTLIKFFNRFSDLPGHFDTERTSVSCEQEESKCGDHSKNLCSGVLLITMTITCLLIVITYVPP